MKKIFYALSLTVFITACHSNKSNDAKVTPMDTVGLAQFQVWKTQNELGDPNAANNVVGQAGNDQVAKTTNIPMPKTTTKSAVSEKGTNSTVTPAPVVAKKKGWSKAAKGTAIGAGTGAVLGAVINKNNRVLGGVVGGVIGGGIGYGIGRSKDKKDGRVN